MAEPDQQQPPPEPMTVLTHHIRRIELELTANNLPNRVHTFNGESHIKYKQWRDDMDQVGDHVDHDDERIEVNYRYS